LLVVWKNRPVKVSPLARVAVMEPERLPELVQLNFTGFVTGNVEPEPVLVVAQPTASATTRRNPALQVIRAILNLQ
jgi:hypothetical protein